LYKVVKWRPDLDLTDFYRECDHRGFDNNSTQSMLVDSLSKEQEWCVWILYYNNTAVGSVGAHSLDIFPGAYRICVRTCAFTDKLHMPTLRTRDGITTHQHVTAQIFMPVCIDWAGEDKDLYISTHPSDVGTQRMVHTVWGPSLEKTGVLQSPVDRHYRGHVQSFWKLNVNEFKKQLDSRPRWLYSIEQ
jgi:hypothetical protein